MTSIKHDNDFEKNYKLVELIGKGSFGEVFRAIEVETGNTVAVKIIEMDDCSSEIEEIYKEISFLSLCSSPYITQYYKSCVIDSKIYIVMEYLGGGSVLDILHMEAIEESYCQIIIRELLRGLNYLHMHKKIHRDIKCANILLSESGDVKIADFGVAGQLTKTVNKRSTFIGTPYWMAPEIIKETECGYGTAVDIWSTGIVCIEMCDRKPPLYTEHPVKAMFIITKNEPPQPQSQKISKLFRSFISQCLTKEPDMRPDAQTLLESPFLRKAKKNHYLKPLIQKYKRHLAIHGRHESTDDGEEASGDNENASGDNEEQEKNGGVSKWLFDTMRVVDRELVKSMVNDAANNILDQKSNDILKVGSSTQSLNSESSNDEDDQSEEIRKKEVENTTLVNVFNRLSSKHQLCSKEIDQFLELAHQKDFQPFTHQLTSVVKKYTPCKQ